MTKTRNLFLGALLPCLINIASATGLTLSKPNTLTYRCTDGSEPRASYYNLSDNSLSFVKLTINGKTHTLPQKIAGSGVLYSDLHQVEWHTKGDTALLNTNVLNDKSNVISCIQKAPSKSKNSEHKQTR